ncbi:MAG: VOC family protein [Bacteroidota bacterium]
MPTINTYLTFNGNCAEAFDFYKSVFGGEFLSINHFREMPPDDRFTIAETDKDKIMHITLPINNGNLLMGSDTAGDWAKGFSAGNNFSLSIDTDSKEQADQFYKVFSMGMICRPPSESSL